MKNTEKKTPGISIVTPSYNQAPFLETTLRSVVSQEYQNIEYIVMDGGSTDGSVAILKKYASRLRFTSKKDNGQSNALNIGLRKTHGEIVGFVNSDDYLEPGALSLVVDYFSRHPEAQWVTGTCRVVDENGREVRKFSTAYKNFFLRYLRYFPVFCVVQFISQPSTFWRRHLLLDIGLFDEKLHYDMDYDYWLRLWKKYPLHFIDRNLSSYRVHATSKAVTSPETQFTVEHEILARHVSNPVTRLFHLVHVQLACAFYRLFWVK